MVSCWAIRLTFLDENVQLSSTTYVTFDLCTREEGESTIIGRGWPKYCDMSEASRSIMGSGRLKAEENNSSARHWQSRYFAITEFKNCFISRTPAQKSDLHFLKRAWWSRISRILFTGNTFRWYYAWAGRCSQAAICRSRAGRSPMKRKNKKL